MKTGGNRPGAGRPAGAKDAVKRTRRWKAKPTAEAGTATEVQAAGGASDDAPAPEAESESPLDYMIRVMRDPATDAVRRDRMAIAAAPFVHARKEPVGQGKREAAQADAEAAAKAGGKFAPRAAPRLAAIGGSRIRD